MAFLDYLGKAPLIAFHVTFDETMIRRAVREYLGFNFKHPWLDLAYVMPSLNPALAKKNHALDDWIGHFGIRIDVTSQCADRCLGYRTAATGGTGTGGQKKYPRFCRVARSGKGAALGESRKLIVRFLT